VFDLNYLPLHLSNGMKTPNSRAWVAAAPPARSAAAPKTCHQAPHPHRQPGAAPDISTRSWNAWRMCTFRLPVQFTSGMHAAG
jgi:hypothetical protein